MTRIAERYELRRQLGEGGMGVVYEAFDERTQTLVAIKQLRPHDLKDPVAVERFRREAATTAQLHHPNIVALLDFVPPPAGAIVLELLRGESLRAALNRMKRLPIEMTTKIASETLAALEASHGAGVIHRDIKPANIFLANGPHGFVTKVLDFGVAKLLEPSGPALTRSSQIVGSATYMAPEQIRGETLDPRSDLFALGLCLYEMLTGRKPFESNSVHENMLRIMSGEPVPLDPALTPPMYQFLRRATAADRNGRYADAPAMHEGYLAALTASGTMTRLEHSQAPLVSASFAGQSPPAALPSPRRPFPIGWVVAAMGVTALLGGAARWGYSAFSIAAPATAASAAASGPAPAAPEPAMSVVASSASALSKAAAPKAGATRGDGGLPVRPPSDGGTNPGPSSNKVCKDNSSCAIGEACELFNGNTYTCQTCEAAYSNRYARPATCQQHHCVDLARTTSDCGTCGHSCNVGEGCVKGACARRVSEGQACVDVDNCMIGMLCMNSVCGCGDGRHYCPQQSACVEKCQ